MTRIAACLIVRNSAATIEETLKTIRPHVDEINIYDTGSTDQTLEILEALEKVEALIVSRETGEMVAEEMHGAPHVLDEEKVGRVPLAPIRWQVADLDEIPLSADGLLGDFSWARERSFEMASPDCDWLLWLDDDDVVVGGEFLRHIAASAHSSLDGFVFFYDYARDESGQNVCALWRERLLRRKHPADWGWRNAVHEVWLPREGVPVTPNYQMVPQNQIRYIHNRPPDRYPVTRNLAILERVVAEAHENGTEPDGRTKAYMGTELLAQGRHAEAIPWLHAYIEDPTTRQAGDERSQVFHKLGMCLRSIGQPLGAIEAEFAAVKERDDWAENAIGLCEAFADAGDWKRCEHWAKVGLALGQPQSMLILNPLEFTLVPYTRLAQACAAQRRFDEAGTWIMKALAVQPNHPIALAVAQGLERDGFTQKVVDALLTLRECLVRFDENQKAYEILLNAPYIVADHPEVVAARAMQRENVMHMLKPEEYTRWYEDEPKESTVPDEWVDNAGDYIERAKFVLERCQKFEKEHGRKPRVLDLGCNDAWMLGYLWRAGGFVGDGIELNKASVLKAQGRIERFGIPGRIVQGNIMDAPDLLAIGEGEDLFPAFNSYDVVTMFEVFEHVPDTDAVLALMESLLTPEGIACVTTPNGAFEDGNIPMWQIVERKGHLRAWPWHELASTLTDRGELDEFKIHHGGSLTYASWKPGPAKKKVVLYAGPAWEQWSPEQIRTSGLGGSETALAVLGIYLSERGHDVRVYTDAKPGLNGRSIWRPAGAFDPTEEADAFVVSRMPHAFDVTLHAPKRVLWCHDHHYGEAVTPQRAERMTDVAVLSGWQYDEWLTMYPFLDGKLSILRNGIIRTGLGGDNRFKGAKNGWAERKPHVIFSSSPDRGLDKLLEVWPTIRQQVPDAELHVFYGWEVFDRAAALRPDLFAFKQMIFGKVGELGGEAGGIFMRGRVGQDELHDAMVNARVWGYPTYFKETSCIGAMEARAAGLPIVTSKLGALAETVGSHGILLSVPDTGEVGSGNVDLGPNYLGPFTEWIEALLTDAETWTKWHDNALDGAAKLDWKYRVSEWEKLLGLVVPAPRKSRAHATA